MLNKYPKFKRGEIEEFYNKLSRGEKTLIGDYLKFRRARGVSTEEKISDIRRYIIQLRLILERDFNKLNLKDMRSLLAIINDSHLSDNVKNNLKIDIKNFLKFLFKDWSVRFSNFDDIKVSANKKNEKKLNPKSILKKEDIEKLVKHEKSNYWKALFLTQYEGSLRTKEVRFLKWDDIIFNVDGDISEINIYATKTKKSRIIFVKEATFYLQKLKEEQENTQTKGVYIFHSKIDINRPISKGAVSIWMRALSQKALGHKIWNYLLRHSRGTELYRLAKEGKIAKDTAIKFMGHSEDMSEFYTHLDESDVKEMLKNQIYKLEDLPEEKKHELEVRIDEQDKKISSLYKILEKIDKKVKVKI